MLIRSFLFTYRHSPSLPPIPGKHYSTFSHYGFAFSGLSFSFFLSFFHSSNGIIHHRFCAWLLSLSTQFLRLFHIVACISSVPFTAEYIIFHHILNYIWIFKNLRCLALIRKSVNTDDTQVDGNKFLSSEMNDTED